MATQQDRVRGYVGNLGVKAPCDLCATANITTLSGEQTIDGVTTNATRILLPYQTTATQNGIYLTSTGTWTREPDFDGDFDIKRGTIVAIGQGTLNNGSVWRLDTTNPVIGTSNLTFTCIVPGGGFSAPVAANQTLTFNSTQTWNTDLGFFAVLTLLGNITMAAPTNMNAGEVYTLKLIQGGAGSYLVTWNSVFKWANGTAPTLSTPVGSIDILNFVSDGSNLFGVIQKAFS